MKFQSLTQKLFQFCFLPEYEVHAVGQNRTSSTSSKSRSSLDVHGEAALKGRSASFKSGLIFDFHGLHNAYSGISCLCRKLS